MIPAVAPDSELAEETPVFQGFVDKQAAMFSPAWSGIAGGSYRPAGWNADLPFPSHPFTVFAASDVYYAPALGLIFREDGTVSAASYVEAKYADAALEQLTALWRERDDVPYLAEASVVMPWGGITNYGHFVLDALTSVPFLRPPLLTPPLRAWQREHFRILGATPLETAAPLCRIGRATYTSALAHSLHRPNLHHMQLRDRYPSGKASGSLLYVARCGHKRPYLSETALIDRLRPLGFNIVQPEDHSVSDQIRLFRDARVIVAPTGAALANCLYCSPGVRVVELIPRDMVPNERAYRWTGYQVAFGRGDWRPFFCETAAGRYEAPTFNGRPRSGYLPFDAAAEEVLAFVRDAL